MSEDRETIIQSLQEAIQLIKGGHFRSAGEICDHSAKALDELEGEVGLRRWIELDD